MNRMYIANPIYDTVFKHLMENNRIARFFVETIIGQQVESIAVKPQEHTYFKTLPADIDLSAMTDEEMEKIEHVLSIIRYDFVAVIRTPEDGYKKVLIEIQKARNEVDLMRFRNYLAEQYKRQDTVTVDGRDTEEVLPVITIYLLGFELPETKAIAIHVSRTYRDMITQTELHVKSEFIECLTHDSYVVQIPQIEGKTRTRLEKLLSLFEQRYFIDDKGIRKEYHHEVDDENIRLMLEILYHTGADPKKQQEIEDEWWSNEYWYEFVVKRDKKIAMQQKELEEKDKTIEESQKALEEKDKALEEKDKVLEANQKALKEKDKENEELRKQLAALNNFQ